MPIDNDTFTKLLTENRLPQEEQVYFKETFFTKRLVSKTVSYCQLGKQRDEYTLSPFSIGIIGIVFFLFIYDLIKYANEQFYNHDIDSFIIECMVGMFFILAGFSIHIIFVNRTFKIETSIGKILVNLSIGAGAGALGFIVQSIVRDIFLSVSAFDYYLFFLCMATAEECVFRLGMQSFLKILFNFNKYFASTISVFITSLSFTLYHTFVYSQFYDLLIIFLISCIFGGVFEFTKSFDTCLFAHILFNAIGGIALINQLFGGF